MCVCVVKKDSKALYCNVSDIDRVFGVVALLSETTVFAYCRTLGLVTTSTH